MKIAIAIVHLGAQLTAHFRLAVFCVELIVPMELAIAVIHDATSFPLSIFEGMLARKVVPKLMGKC